MSRDINGKKKVIINMKIIKNILKLFWMIKQLGFRKAFSLLMGKYFKDCIPKSKMVDVAPKTFEHPFYVRLNSTDVPVFWAIILGCEYGQGEYTQIFERSPKYAEILDTAEVIVDLGANIGAFDVWLEMAKKGKTVRKLIAVEPEESNMKLLELNTKHLPYIKRYCAGVWNKCGFLKIYSAGSGEWAFSVREASNNEEPDVRAIDIWTIMQDNAIERIDILKVDIEGTEYELFAEHYEWINQIGMLIIETHDTFKPGSKQMVINRMTGYGFVHEQIGEDLVFVRR